MLGRAALQETLAAITEREYQRAGAAALGGVATPLRIAGEALAALIEALAQPGTRGAEWRDRVVRALDDTVPALLDGMQALYANVLFERLLHPRDEALFTLDVPDADEVTARAAADIAAYGREKANLDHAGRVFAEATQVLEIVLRVAETWSSCANEVEKLDEFYPLAGTGAKALMDRATTFRVASAVFRAGSSEPAPVTPHT